MSRDECSQFLGRRREICEGRANLSIAKINAYRQNWGLDPLPMEVFESLPETTQRRAKASAVRVASSRGGCCNGPPPTKPGPVSFTQKLINRAASLKAAAVDFWNDGMTLATEGQQASRTAVCGACPLNVGGWCDDSRGGCGCNLSMKVKARAAHCPLGKWSAYRDDYRPLIEPKRSLIFHLYPKLGAEWNWHWHIEQIRKYAPVFTDKIVIGVGVGSETATIEEVQALCSGIPVTHWLRADNDKLAETNTHVEMLSIVQSDDPEAVVFRYHTKGVTKSPGSVEQVWAEIMWAGNMHLPSVDDAMASHLVACVLRSQEPLVQKKPGGWFPAGSAYWFRAKEAFERDWRHTDSTRWWVEYWPGHVFRLEESACLFHDLVPSSVLRQSYFDEHVLPEWAAWKLARGIE